MMDEELWSVVRSSADRLKVEAAVLMAVIEVESSGKFFAKVAGKSEPLIRFEGHYFDRRLIGSTRARARLRGISSPVAGVVKNPASQTDRWDLLNKAIALNRTAALESTSWGIGQVMGANWKWLGFDNVEELVETARSGMAGQVELMVRYIEKAGLISALQTKNWSAFARGYNGPGYAKHAYHTKLAEAYLRAAKVQIPQARDQVSSVSPDTLRRGDRGERVQELQRQLTALGYVVDADGVFGGSTEAALKQFQSANSIPADGTTDPQTDITMANELPQLSAWQWMKQFAKSALRRIV
jgi:hypothetical protein